MERVQMYMRSWHQSRSPLWWVPTTRTPYWNSEHSSPPMGLKTQTLLKNIHTWDGFMQKFCARLLSTRLLRLPLPKCVSLHCLTHTRDWSNGVWVNVGVRRIIHWSFSLTTSAHSLMHVNYKPSDLDITSLSVIILSKNHIVKVKMYFLQINAKWPCYTHCTFWHIYTH